MTCGSTIDFILAHSYGWPLLHVALIESADMDCWLPLPLCCSPCAPLHARREVGRRAGVPVQEFCVQNDMHCGSTIGPTLAHNLDCPLLHVTLICC
jgi:hypothetical protein